MSIDEIIIIDSHLSMNGGIRILWAGENMSLWENQNESKQTDRKQSHRNTLLNGI